MRGEKGPKEIMVNKTMEEDEENSSVTLGFLPLVELYTFKGFHFLKDTPPRADFCVHFKLLKKSCEPNRR